MNIREAQFSDFPAIREVCARNGVSHSGVPAGIPLDPSDDNESRFSRLWSGNPNRMDFKNVPIGWVLEDNDGKIVGTLSNLHSAYELNGVRLKAGVASSWAVDPPYRSQSLGLMSKFLFQKNVDLVLNATANFEAAEVLKAFKARAVPIEDYDRVLFWITNYPGFVKGFMQSRFGLTSSSLSYLAGHTLRLLNVVRAKNRIQLPVTNSELVRPEDLRLERFWQRIRQEAGTLRAVRDSSSLAWHFDYSLKIGATKILVLPESDNEISGYIILKRRDAADRKFSRLQIVDIQALSNQEETLVELLSCAVQLCRAEKIDVLEAVGFSDKKRSVFRRFSPYSRRFPNFPFFYKVLNKKINSDLTSDKIWDPCLFDGDASLG